MTDLEKVRKNGHALKYVENQTPEICLAAVKEDGESLYYVKNKTPEICLAALEQDDEALEFVPLELIKETFKLAIKPKIDNTNIINYSRFEIMDFD